MPITSAHHSSPASPVTLVISPSQSYRAHKTINASLGHNHVITPTHDIHLTSYRIPHGTWASNAAGTTAHSITQITSQHIATRRTMKHVFGLATAAENVPRQMERLEATYNSDEQSTKCLPVNFCHLSPTSIKTTNELINYGHADRNLVNNENSHAHMNGRKYINLSSKLPEKRPQKCLVCLEGCQSMQFCRKFEELCHNAKWDIVIQNQLRICCLTSHPGPLCMKIECGVDGCIRPHHPLLHAKKKRETITTLHSAPIAGKLEDRQSFSAQNPGDSRSDEPLTAPRTQNLHSKQSVHQESVIPESRQKLHVAQGIKDITNSMPSPSTDGKFIQSLTHHEPITPYTALSEDNFRARISSQTLRRKELQSPTPDQSSRVTNSSRKKIIVDHGINDVINSSSAPTKDEKFDHSPTKLNLFASHQASSERNFIARSSSAPDRPPGHPIGPYWHQEWYKKANLYKSLVQVKWKSHNGRQFFGIIVYDWLFDCPGLLAKKLPFSLKFFPT